MADHMIKMNEVPKGQRYQQFKDYYRIPVIIGIIVVIAVISILKTTVFSPKPDAFLLIASEAVCDEKFTEQIEEFYSKSGEDFNGDNKSLISITPVQYNDVQLKTDPEVGMAMQTKLMAVLSSAENILQIVDDELYEYFSNQGLIGTYSDLGEYATEFENESNDEIKIPLSEIPFFQNEVFSGKTDGFYMTVRPRDGSQLGGKKKKIENYENQISVFMTFFEQ